VDRTKIWWTIRQKTMDSPEKLIATWAMTYGHPIARSKISSPLVTGPR
jgi:hypothetical protein